MITCWYYCKIKIVFLKKAISDSHVSMQTTQCGNMTQTWKIVKCHKPTHNFQEIGNKPKMLQIFVNILSIFPTKNLSKQNHPFFQTDTNHQEIFSIETKLHLHTLPGNFDLLSYVLNDQIVIHLSFHLVCEFKWVYCHSKSFKLKCWTQIKNEIKNNSLLIHNYHYFLILVADLIIVLEFVLVIEDVLFMVCQGLHSSRNWLTI